MSVAIWKLYYGWKCETHGVKHTLLTPKYSGEQTKNYSQRKKSLQRKFFAKKRMQRKQRKMFREIRNFWEILPWSSQFFGHFLMKISFCKTFIHVSLKNLSLKITNFMTCVTILIHYYKMENYYVIFIIKNFFAFFACYCKDFEIFFACSLHRKFPV